MQIQRQQLIKLAQKLLRGQIPELRDRLQERLRIQSERRHYLRQDSHFTPEKYEDLFTPGFLSAYGGTGDLNLSHALRNHDPHRFYPGFCENHDFSAFVLKREPENQSSLLQASDAILNDDFVIFHSHILNYGTPPKWNCDPTGQKCAPLCFYSDIDSSASGAVGDPKVIWELSRLQFVYDLGQAYRLTSDEKYSAKCFELIRDWSHFHPDYRGIAFCSALEWAFRINSLIWAVYFFQKSPLLTGQIAREIYRLLFISADFLEHHLSRHFAPNTHLMGEGYGLFIAGLLFPEFSSAARWLSLGKNILRTELDRQITREGMHAERSVAYHAYALEFFLCAVILAARNDQPFEKVFYDRIRGMSEVLARFQRPDGSWSAVGDHDGGRLHFLTRTGPLNFEPILEASRLFASGRSEPNQRLRYRESYWLSGTTAADAHAPAIAPQSSTYLPDAGYFISRSSRNMYSLFHCGQFGYLDSPHSHADMLHLDLSVGADNFLIDPGTCVYTSDIRLRNLYRSERSHNGPALAGTRLAHPTDPFAWLTQPDCKATECFTGATHDCISAGYEILEETGQRASISRSVLFLHDRFWIVHDRISADQPRQAHWTFISPCDATCEEKAAVLKGKESNLTILSAFSPVPDCDCSLADTEYSEDYLSRQPASALRYKAAASPRTQGLFLMVPTQPDTNPLLNHQVFRDSGRIAVTFNIGNDAYVLSAGEKESELADLRTDARLALIDSHFDSVRSCLLLGGSYVSLGGKTLLRFPSRLSYAYARWQNGTVSLETSGDEAPSLEQAKLMHSILLKNLAN